MTAGSISLDAERFDIAIEPATHGDGSRRRGVGVAVDRLSKNYAGRRVLEDVRLYLRPGEFVAIVGRSGCGKSTLLRAIAQLETADAGEVRIGDARLGEAGVGETRNAEGQGRAELRMMFQEARLLPWKSVRDNVALGLPREPGQATAATALATVGLADRADAWPSELSGGQRQRVALARALVHEPRLLLLDEPLGALDALTRIEMQRLIESLWRANGFTAVLVTHDVQEALALADRVVVIDDGGIALEVAVDLARPRQRGDAGFAALERRLLDRLLDPPAARGEAA